MLGLKIFVGVQTFRRRPFVPSHSFCHPGYIWSGQKRFSWVNILILKPSLWFTRYGAVCFIYAHSGGYLKIITEHFETSEYKKIMFVCIFVDFKTFGNEKIMFAGFPLCSIYTLKHLEASSSAQCIL